jgi:hypothetical protein
VKFPLAGQGSQPTRFRSYRRNARKQLGFRASPVWRQARLE